jgi:hypothetical protein
MMTGALTKILGGQVLRDAQTFVTALDTMFGGFRERAEAPTSCSRRRARRSWWSRRPSRTRCARRRTSSSGSKAERMPLAGLILNRVHAAETLEAMPNGGGATAPSASYPVTAAALRLHAGRMNLGMREQRVAGSFMSTHPAVPVIEVPALPEDVHDLAGLRRVGEEFTPQDQDAAR